MSEWRAAYTNDYGEYEITFESKDRAKTKAVEKVCCAIIDGLVKSPEDVIVGARPKGKWEFIDGEWTDYECSECGSQSTQESLYCPSCGARMEETVCRDG